MMSKADCYPVPNGSDRSPLVDEAAYQRMYEQSLHEPRQPGSLFKLFVYLTAPAGAIIRSRNSPSGASSGVRIGDNWGETASARRGVSIK